MADLSIFKFSEPGAPLTRDPSVREYLQTYQLPIPPQVRYGHVRFPSPQENYRVGLFGQAWAPEHSVGTVVLLHGLSEHSGNYGQLIQDFCAAHLSVATLDLRGHGLSEGPRGHTDTPECYAEDVEQFLRVVLPTLNPNRPLFFFGHSMGGLIALHLLLRKNIATQPRAIALTSPFLGFPEIKGPQKILSALAPLVNCIAPSLAISHGIADESLTHDTAYLARRAEDPLVSIKVSPRWLLSTRKLMEEVQARAGEFAELCPAYMLLASDERVVNLEAARSFGTRAFSGRQHRIAEFPGFRHELEKEPKIRSRIVGEVISWFLSHIPYGTR